MADKRDPIKLYDARWEAGEFGDDAVRRLFEATLIYGRRLGVDTITIARDARLHAHHVMQIAIETAFTAGFRVLVCPEPISTPQSYFLALHVSQEHPATMGLMITASHNPRDHIGVKFTIPVVRAIGLDCGPSGGLTAVRTIYHGREECPARPGGRVKPLSVTTEYIEYSTQQAGVGLGALRGIGVVLDTLHGSAGPELACALGRAGARVRGLRLLPDGHFPTGAPNPIARGRMDQATEATRRKGMHIAIGVDGDGDRIVIGDHRGLLAAGFAALPVLRALSRHGWPDEQARALHDPKVNPVALAEWVRLGVRPVLFRNGHAQIKDCMIQVAARFAAEESGHYYHRMTMGEHTVACENSLLTILLILHELKKDRALLDQLWAMQSSICTTGEFNFRFDMDDTRDRAMHAVARDLVQDGASGISHGANGVGLGGMAFSKAIVTRGHELAVQAGWYNGFVRPSETEKGVLRCYFSAGEPEVLERIEQRVRAILADDFRGQPAE